ncbi:MAG: flippase-like domain-containing protein [Bacilli bacterium]|nr:flippase-like domain-containing protein [Bacilli bacterium]
MKKLGEIKKYIFSILIIIFLTLISNIISLYKDFDSILLYIKNCNVFWLILLLASILISLTIDALIVKMFVNSYLKNYSFFSALVTNFIGTFFNSIAPSFSGSGQIAKAYTLSKQGVPLRCGASLMVISIILTEIVMLALGIFTLFFRTDLLTNIGGISLGRFKLSLYPYSITAFFFNLIIIVLIGFMCFSYIAQNFFINLLASVLKYFNLINNADQLKENLSIRMESFRIELKRSIKNFGLTLTLAILIFFKLVSRFSMPWFIGMMLNGFNQNTFGNVSFSGFINACLMSNYHYLSVNLIPIPGTAGVSELFFVKLFEKFYINKKIVKASQLIWRFFTYYFMFLISFLVTIFYKFSPIDTENINYDYKTFVTVQFELLDDKSKSFLKKMINKNNNVQKIYDLDSFIEPDNEDDSNFSEMFDEKNNKKRFNKWRVLDIN